MSKLIRFEAEHLLSLIHEPANAKYIKWFENGIVWQFEKEGDSMTYIHDGKVMVCGGCLRYWEGRAAVWTIFSEESKYHFVPVMRTIKKFIKYHTDKYNRIEMSVDHGYMPAYRRANLLGFKLEVPLMKSFLSNGGDVALFTIVKETNVVR